MAWFPLKKKKKLKKKTSKAGFFSTDVMLPKNKMSRAIALQERLKITFQKGIESLVPINADGKPIAGASKFAMDDQNTSLTQTKLINSGLYQGVPDILLGWYAGQGFIGFQTCAILMQQWLIEKCCRLPAEDATRNGFEITVNDGVNIDPKILAWMRKRDDKKYKLTENMVKFITKGRGFGIRVAMFKVKSTDKGYYTKPFNIDGVAPGSYLGIVQIDPYWISPELSGPAASDPSSLDFYEPTWWRIAGERVHRSHLVIMRTSDLPDLLKPSYIYAGVSIPQKIYERVYAAERTANEAPMLAMTKRLTTLKVDITQAVVNKAAFDARMIEWTDLQNNHGARVIGGEEEVEQFDTSLAELDAVIMSQYQIVAAAAEIPATKLMGTTPKGFNATGEYDEKSYHEQLRNYQKHELTAFVERHHLLMIKSDVAPAFNIPVFSSEINWNPVDSETAKELADTNLQKAQTDNLYVTMGAISGEDVRNRLIVDKKSGYNGLPSTAVQPSQEEIEASTDE